MRRLLFVTVLALLLGAVPAHAKAKLCDDRPGQTLAASKVGRVFLDRGNPDVPVVRGCKHGSRRTVRMAADNDCMEDGAVGQIAIAGRYVALTRITCGLVEGSTSVLVFDLQGARDVLGTSGYSGEVGSQSSTNVPELAVAPNGAVAWVGTLTSTGVQRSELHVRRPGAAPGVVDEADGAGIDDLALSSRTVFWRHGGQVRSQDL